MYRDDDKKRGRPYVYPTTVILRCYVVRIWMRIPSNNCLHQYFSIDVSYNQKVMKACGLDALPDRRTFDRRFKVLPVGSIISAMGARFVTESLADASIVSVDSSTIRARNGHIWHRKQMIQGTVPRPGIDTDAGWGFSATKGWQFGYKLHISCSTGQMVVPLSASVTTANVYDNQVYRGLVEPLPDCIRYVVADAGYDDWKLYDYTRQRAARLVCPIRRYRHTKGERLELIWFYRSRKGQRIYRARSRSVEPLFECIKGTFGISSSPVIGSENVTSYLLMCVFVYQISVYYNCIAGSDKPRCIRQMLGN
ncbi:MAG: transposase [Thaumarchaeota archaeon]|nr:transposase [Nitrososphaerota archaeon]